MAAKLQTKAEYDASSMSVASLKAGVLELMTRLGDIADDIVIVGGLAPILLFADADVPPTGTLDVDLGLSLALLKEDRYQALEDRLVAAGFGPDTNEKGNPSPQRWICDPARGRVAVDLLMPLFAEEASAGKPQFLTKRLAAFATPGIELAHLDVVSVALRGEALGGGQASRSVSVCGPGAFVALKALAFANRGERKDAHDLIYALECAGVAEVARRIAGLSPSAHLDRAVAILRADFSNADGIGPVRVAQFRSSTRPQDSQADAAGRVRGLLQKLDKA